MASSLRSRLLAHWPALALVALLLVVYFPLVTFQALPVSDDHFTGDLLDGEFPLRVAAGQAWARGEAATWLPSVFGGIPLHAGGGTSEPVSLVLFTLLPPVVALDLLLVLLLCVAGLGAYRLARALGAGQAGALLCGIAFAQSGFMTCQLRHLSVVTTVACVPWALVALEAAFARLREGLRAALGPFALFALLVGEQVLAGFPQSLFIACLVYGAWALVRAAGLRDVPAKRRVAALALAGAAVVLGAGVGAVQLLPLQELASVSDRARGVSAEFANRTAFWLPDTWSFLVPYLHGDASDGTYTGRGVFWEDYAYLGLLAFLLAAGTLWRVRRAPKVAFLWLLAIGSFLVVLGPATPVFPLAFRFVPGMSMFRLPTRFLFVTELSLALLAALGLTFVEERFSRAHAAGRWTRSPALVPFLLAALGAADVSFFNTRQNTFDAADGWMTPPATVAHLPQGEPSRVFTPAWGAIHKALHKAAPGWAGDPVLLRELRGFLQPQIGLLWGVETADGYIGLSPRWTIDFWGDHNRAGLLARTAGFHDGSLVTTPTFFRLLAMNDVRTILTPTELSASEVTPVAVEGAVHMYALRDPLPRARLVARAWSAPSDEAAAERLVASNFDPRAEVILDGPVEQGSPGTVEGSARIFGRSTTSVTVATEASAPAWLVLAETWYPGWHASVDGAEVPVRRANINQRAVAVPAGAHEVRFWFSSRPIRIGLAVTLVSLIVLGAILFVSRRRPAALA